MDRIRVLVADDTAIAREGMRRVVEGAQDMIVVAEAHTTQQAVQLAEQLQPDIVLLDLMWFGNEKAGADAIPQIVRSAPQSKVIAITAYVDLIDLARRNGAAIGITKEVTRRQLHDIIRDVHASSLIPPVQDELTLTEREEMVLALLAEGRTDRQIAAQLHLAESTIKNYVGNILAKLDVSNRTQAAVVAVQRGLVNNKSS